MVHYFMQSCCYISTLTIFPGTAKQHIEMLEEHILTLEEDLANKDNEITDLETRLQVSFSQNQNHDFLFLGLPLKLVIQFPF